VLTNDHSEELLLLLLLMMMMGDAVVPVDWIPRQFSGDDQVMYAKRMFREMCLYTIYLIILCSGTWCFTVNLSGSSNHNYSCYAGMML